MYHKFLENQPALEIKYLVALYLKEKAPKEKSGSIFLLHEQSGNIGWCSEMSF